MTHGPVSGVDLKVIQQRLGHASFATTANLYTHLMNDSQAKAVEKLAAMMAETKSEGTLSGQMDNAYSN